VAIQVTQNNTLFFMKEYMRYWYKTITIVTIILALFGIGLMTQYTRAANPDAFIVEVVPSSFDVNESVDLTIKAVKADGSIVSDYLGDVFIEIAGIVDTADYTVPSDGVYVFQPGDQWVKLFSKGLAIKRSWTFAITVSDIIQDHIMGQRTVIVGKAADDIVTEWITIMSPIAWWVEKNNIINVMATTPTLPNAPYEIIINTSKVSEGMTTSNGDISAYVSWVREGDNVMQIKILNATNQVIGESQTISFRYEPIKDGVFNNIQTQPSNRVKQGEKITFTVNTSESVTSTQLKLSDGKSIPMDKSRDGVFSKEVFMDTKGNITVDVDLIVLWQTTTYTGVTRVIVEDGVGIGKIRLYSDSIDKSKLNVTREVIGEISQYRIDYGTERNNLNMSLVVQRNEIIIENLSIGETYYFRITPLDSAGNTMGPSSDITEAKIGEEASCTVVGIVITTGQIGDKYYLMRSGVQNVEKYIIYRSDFEYSDSSQMQKIGETEDTMFEYPFNPVAKEYKYAYYIVEAVCKDGTNIKIDNVKKVVVWPAENIMLIILISLFAYVTYRLYGYSKN